MCIIMIWLYISLKKQQPGQMWNSQNSFELPFQIDRASAGNVKRSKEEIANDPEKEDDFGYTTSEFSIS